MNILSKGKVKDPSYDSDFEDLNPTITYRHLLGPYTSVKHPLRVVALCDGDAFYAGCERVRLNLDWDIPLVVNQWGMVIAVNYPARSYGISRIDKIPECLKRCPHLKIVHVATFAEGEDEAKYWKNPNMKTHKVSLDLYRRESDKIITMFKGGLPTGEVEKASIDEAFIDFTIPVREKILERFPHLATVPADAVNGIDTPLPPPPPVINWEGLGNLIPVHPPPKPEVKPEVTDVEEVEARLHAKGEYQVKFEESAVQAEQQNVLIGEEKFDTPLSEEPAISVSPPAFSNNSFIIGDVAGPPPIDQKKDSDAFESVKIELLPREQIAEEELPPTWHDVALSIAAELMGKIRMDIYTKLGYTTSAGLARNKFLSKLAAGSKKPFGQSILRNAAIPKFLRPMPFQKIRYLGGKLGTELAKEYDAKTVGEMHKIALEEMQNKFGESSIWVYEILRGIDRNEVKEKPLVRKSMLASKTLPDPITRVADGPHWIRMLAVELSIRLKEARETTPGLWPRTISLHVSQGWHFRRSRQASFPFTKNITIDLITLAGVKLWEELVGKDGTYYLDGTAQLNVSGLSLSLCHIDWMEDGQKNINSFFSRQLAPAHTGTGLKRRTLEDGNGDDDHPDVESREGNEDPGPNAKKRRWRSASVTGSGMSGAIDVDALDMDTDNALAVLPVEPRSANVERGESSRAISKPQDALADTSAGTNTRPASSKAGAELIPTAQMQQRSTTIKDKGKAKEAPNVDVRFSFRCSRCGRTINLDPKYRNRRTVSRDQRSPDMELLSSDAKGIVDGVGGIIGDTCVINDDERQNALTTLRMEHDDYHFAQDLAKAGDIFRNAPASMAKPPVRITGGDSERRSTSVPLGKQTLESSKGKGATSKSTKRPVKPEGIAKYFIKK